MIWKTPVATAAAPVTRTRLSAFSKVAAPQLACGRRSERPSSGGARVGGQQVSMVLAMTIESEYEAKPARYVTACNGL